MNNGERKKNTKMMMNLGECNKRKRLNLWENVVD